MPRRQQPAPNKPMLTAVPATAVDDTETEPWERQQQESDAAWQAFVLYRDMLHRSLRELARSIAEQRGADEKTTFRRLGRWSHDWQWQERCRAWDNERDRRQREAMLRRHTRSLESAQQILAHPISVFVELLRQEPLLPQLLAERILMGMQRSPTAALADYDRLLTLVARTSTALASLIPLERLSRGMSIENMAMNLTGEGALDGSAAQHCLTLDDPAVAAGIRAVLLRAHGSTGE